MNTHFLPTDIVATCRPVHPELHPYIHKYVFRKKSIPPGCSVQKVMPLRSESSIDFFLGDGFETELISTGHIVPFERCTIRGPRTHIIYSINLKGEFISFSIKFNATGLYKLLGIPMDKFTNKAIPGSVISQLPFEAITDQLLHAKNISVCIQIIEPYLLLLAEKSRPVPVVIDKAAQLIADIHELNSISGLANDSYISLRQLERDFIKYMGICPKTYCRMQRFLRLLKAKKNTPELKWTTLAHDFGYYDQMHLVKEFKHFLKTTPSAFVSSDFAF